MYNEIIYLCLGLAALKLIMSCRRRFKKFELYRKHVIITGAGSGLGRELARECFFKGAYITIIGRNKSTLISLFKDLEPNSRSSEIGNFVQIFDSDLSTNKNFELILNAAEKRFGPVNLFIACAGTLKVKIPQISADDAKYHMENNYNTVFNTVLPVAKVMMNRKKGRICVVSTGEIYAGGSGSVEWVASKAAVHSLADSIRAQLKEQKVHLSIFAPGWIKTESLKKACVGNAEMLERVEKNAIGLEKACSELLTGISACDPYITTSLFYRLCRVCSLGASERPNILFDILLSPISILLCAWHNKVHS